MYYQEQSIRHSHRTHAKPTPALYSLHTFIRAHTPHSTLGYANLTALDEGGSAGS